MNDNNADADNELRDWAYEWKLHCHREVVDNAATPASSSNCSAEVI
jgi:hypothetical protein